MAKVILKNISKIYENDYRAVNSISLEITDKEFMVLVGPSGCGKSTTLRMIAGLEDISEGDIFIGERLVNDILPKNRDIAMVFQNYALYPHMTVYENMAFGLKLRKFPRKEIKERVIEAAKILNLEEYLERKPKQLSGGQRQRVALGRAIVRKPAVFLFDEPLSNLDAKMRVQMRAEINKLHNQLATTMIYVTHDQTEAMTMGNRICVMRDGVIQQVSNPIQLYDKPVNLFVAGFIGTPGMNFFQGSLILRDNKLWFDEGSFEFVLPDDWLDKVKNAEVDEVILGVRPENILLEGRDTLPKIKAQVEMIEPMGAETYFYFKTPQNSFIARMDPYIKAHRGDVLTLKLNIDKAHLFDKKSEKNLLI